MYTNRALLYCSHGGKKMRIVKQLKINNMDNRYIIGGTCHNSFNSSLFDNIVLGRTEEYDARSINCWSFCKGTDIRNGIKLALGNLCKGFPFLLHGHLFQNSETAYLCGEFSVKTSINQSVQRKLVQESNPFIAKKVIKRQHIRYIREDWEEVRLQWMLYVVWRKCIGNVDFRNLLLSLPADAVIIEDSTANHSATSSIWGAKNKELRAIRKEKEKELTAKYSSLKKKELNELISVECGRINNIGCFVGENNLGKILKLCQIALQHNTVPPVDYKLLKNKGIYMFGELLTFEEAA